MLKFKGLITVLSIALFFTACKKNNSSSTNNDTPSSADCKACVYTPDCVNISYTYQDQIASSAATTRVITYSSLSDTSIGGIVYQKITTPTGNSYQNCDNGVTTSISYNAVGTSGSTVAEIKVVPLKANGAVGTTWTDHVTSGGGQDNQFDYTIEEKGISRVVLGVTFTNVIHVTAMLSVNYMGTNVPEGQVEYYYAQGIGLIESTTTISGSLYESTYLKTYSIPN
jgi:hypothetical protein